MRLVLALVAMLWIAPAMAALERPEFSPVLGAGVDLATPLTDEAGTTATLGQWLAGKPAVVLFGYHDCPNLCGVVQQAIARLLAGTGLDRDGYRTLFITVAPEEDGADAAAAKARLADAAGAEVAAPWHFLSGAGVVTLAQSFGIGALERERIRQFVHPVATFTVTRDGRISHVLPGLELSASDLRLAIVEASAGQLGSVVDHVLLFCAGYDPTTGRYTPVVMAGLRIGALVVLACLLAAIALLEIRKRRWAA
ncbi:MAG: SCO family protein [Devosia sp.]